MTPITRREAYLAYIAGTYSGDLPAPVTREEQYLYDIAVNGSGSAVQADWQQDDATAKDYIKNKPVLGTAAEKDSTNAVTANSTDLVESGAVKVAINEAISGLYFPAGDITCAELIPELLINDNLGKVYNATDSGLSTTYFVGGAGKTINAGDNIAIVNTGTVENPVYLFDNFTGLVDLSTYQKKLLTTPIIVDGTETTTVESALNAINTYAEENSDNISDIQSIIPSDASAQNPLATIHDVTEENIKSSSTTSPLTDSADARVQGMTVYGASRTSKNLLEITAETRTINGVTFTVDKEAGSIIANGTNTSSNTIYFRLTGSGSVDLPAGRYHLSGGVDLNGVILYNDGHGLIDTGNGSETTFDTETSYPIIIRVIPNATLTNAIFKPMLCTAEDYEADPTFEPYFEGIKSVGEGYAVVDLGTLDWSITSSPEMHVFRASMTNVSPAIKQPVDSWILGNYLCGEYLQKAWAPFSEVDDGCYGISNSLQSARISIVDYNYDNVTDFVAHISGVLLCYELADPSQGNSLAVKTDNGTGIDGIMATFTTALPLRSVSDTVRDVMEWDGTSGEVTKKCNKVRLADLTWTLGGYNQPTFYSDISNLKINSINAICNIYNFIGIVTGTTTINNMPDKSCAFEQNGITIFIKDTDYTTVSDFVASLGDAELVYELATSVTTPLTDTEISAFRGLRTFDSTTNITITDNPEFEIDYLKNSGNGQAVADVQKDLQGQIDEVKNITKPRVYAFYVDQNDSNPATCVHPYYNTKYGCDNLFYQNAYMDYEKDEFNYGSWEEFIKEFFKPCMLAYDGHVDYYLDPDDYETKLDGGTSDIKDMTYNGNVMVQIKTLYFKRWTTNGKYYCIISDKKLDKSFKAFAHHDIKGNVLDYIYRAAYDGSYDGIRLRSISGVDYYNENALTVNKIMSNTTRQQEIDFAKANNDANEKGEGWNILHKAEWDLINDLLLLIGMSTNTQVTFGNGNISSYVSTTDTGIISTGTMDKKGLFYGKNDNVSGVKVFGIEMPWGNILKSCLGWILSANQHLVKMTPGDEDGSTATDYNLDGTGYIATGKSITASGYISAFDGADTGFVSTAASGSDTTYMCDYVWQNAATYFLLVGGSSNGGALCGAFYTALSLSATYARWDVGTVLSYKPLARG